MTKEDVIEILERFVIGAKPCSQREIVYACASAYRMLKEQPSVPSNLDEAAEKNFETMEVFEHENIFEETHNRIFKAGAEWMAGQGESHETEIVSRVTGNGLLPAVTCLVNKSYKEGDKVVIQIRKK